MNTQSFLKRALLALLLVLTNCAPGASDSATVLQSPLITNSAGAINVRQPAVAGLFYPKDAKQLSAAVDRYLAASTAKTLPGVRALICPHAGYEYSGPVAGISYKQIADADFDKVIILAASHYAWFQGVSVPATEAYETPLGRVPVWAKARELAKTSPFVLEPRTRIQRPGWSAMASKPSPAAGEDTPETWEHSVEVQIPFLQRSLKQFQILPVIFGVAEPERVAKALAPLIDDRTLVVASSDLSHYHPYAEAGQLDRETLKWVCDSDLANLQSPAAEECACGRMPILTLLHLARLKGWSPHLLDYRNSGDASGDKARVVGYGAVAFTSPPAPSGAAQVEPPTQTTPALFSLEERKLLLGLARQALTEVTAGRPLPKVASDAVPVACRASKGCFVTLTKAGELRGCIGNILPVGPLYQSVLDNARSAALRDPRFPPVTAAEAKALQIEVSVLTIPEPLLFSSADDLLSKLQPHRDGVVLKIGDRSATFLPQVWEQLPTKTEFLSHLAQKAGCAPSAWAGKDVTVFTYRAEAFEEPK